MTTRDIISKLTSQLDKAITTEAQAVYLLVGIRKIIEQDKIGREYADLRLHCDWALHSSLDRTAAIAILKKFDTSHASSGVISNCMTCPRRSGPRSTGSQDRLRGGVPWFS